MESLFPIILLHPLDVAGPTVRMRLIRDAVACGVGIVEIRPDSGISQSDILISSPIRVLTSKFLGYVFLCEWDEQLVPHVARGFRIKEDVVVDRAIVSGDVSVRVRALPDYFIQTVLSSEHSVHQNLDRKSVV